MTRPPSVAVLDYGIGNLRSAQKALQTLGADAVLTDDPGVIAAADGVVLPGVGNFGACMAALDRHRLPGPIRDAVASGRPFLGICVGMQLLYEGSEESPDAEGLGVLPGTVRRLTGSVKVPQMQWNQLVVEGETVHPLLTGVEHGWMYFVHSFAAPVDGNTIATVDYGGPVAAAVADRNVWAVQFHPEKSARSGLALLKNWVTWVAAAAEGEAAAPDDRQERP